MHELPRLLGFIENRHDLSDERHLSGGCVEKEGLRQFEIVFRTRKSIECEYDGTYRLGCKGLITVLNRV